MIPAEEQERLRKCVREAWELAEQGQVLRGYGVLKLGLTWAETPAIHPVRLETSPPEPWAAELAARYREELVRYAAAFHPVLESCCLAQHPDTPPKIPEPDTAARVGQYTPAGEPVRNVAQQVWMALEQGRVH